MVTRRSSKTSGETRKRSYLHRGEEGRNRVDTEMEEAKKRREAAKSSGPFRFYTPVGDTKEIVILDEEPDTFGYEHNFKDPKTGRWSINLTCVDEWENCPACADVKKSSYVLYLSVLDLTPFEDSSGTTHEFSRKLMVVKQGQQKKFIRKFNKDGSLRGMIVEMTRDGAKDAAIGNDIEFTGEVMDEEELAEYVRTWKDRDGKMHEEDCGEPYDYEEVIPEPSLEAIEAAMDPDGTRKRARTGTTRKARSKDEGRLEEEEEEGFEDEEEYEGEWETEDEEPKKSRRTPKRSSSPRGGRSTRRGRKQADAEEEDSYEDDKEADEAEEDAPRPRRRVNKPAGTTRRTTSTRQTRRARRG